MRFTTILLIILIIVVTTCVSNGQITIKEIDIRSNKSLTEFSTGEIGYQTKIDTIKSYILVSMHPTLKGIFKPCYTVLGYEVIKQDGYSFESSYLHVDKTPFDKYLVVWMSKPIEK